jgi:hypothetical protein
VGAGESLLEESDGELSEGDPVDEPRLPGAVDDPSPEPLVEPPRAREVPREGAFVDGEEPEDESVALEPVDPAEPVVSAAANGTEAIAEPTPSTTARAPTRPTYRA